MFDFVYVRFPLATHCHMSAGPLSVCGSTVLLSEY